MVDSGSGGGARRVWIFHGDAARFASGVFNDKASGLAWIARHGLTGILTEYEVGDGCYDLALCAGRFRDSKPHHGSPGHVASFSPGLAHIHVRDGQPGS
jgi:hypothetical protein